LADRAALPLRAGDFGSKERAAVAGALQDRRPLRLAQLSKLRHRKVAGFLYHSLDVKLPATNIDRRRTEVAADEEGVVGSELVYEYRHRCFEILGPRAAHNELPGGRFGALGSEEKMTQGTDETNAEEIASARSDHGEASKHCDAQRSSENC
jgi:hypothetical protein